MEKVKQLLKKRWIWGLLVLLICTAGFTVYMNVKHHQNIEAADETLTGWTFQNDAGTTIDAGGSFTTRRSREQYRLYKPKDSSYNNITYKWHSANTNIMQIESGENTATPMLKVNKETGKVAITVDVTWENEAGEKKSTTLSMTVEVLFSINEYLNETAKNAGSQMIRIYNKDSRNALVMEYGAVLKIGNETSDDSYLKLIFGNGQDASWTSSNEDVIKYPADGNNKAIQAVGAGTAKLTVTYNYGGGVTLTDTIDVYVRPQITSAKDNKALVGGMTGDHTNPAGSVTVENNDKINVSIMDTWHPEFAIADKLVWVISKGEGENSKLVRDSLGNTGDDADEANLVYIRSEKAYRIQAKSGIYNIQFYVKGTYTTFADSKDAKKASNAGSINLTTSVNCSFNDKRVSLSLGSIYNLADAFNIPLKTLKANFSPSIVSGGAIVSVDWNTSIVSTKDKLLGTATIVITKNGQVTASEIPGLAVDQATITVNVEDTFKLNISDTTMAVGSKLDLNGIIGSDAEAEESQFAWSVSDNQYVSLSSTVGRYVTVTALKETPLNNPAVVTLSWTDTRGITWVAQCEITVTTTASDFTISPATKRLEVGGTDYLQTNLTGKQNIIWLSSDTSIVTVDPQTGNVGAKITATQKTGQVVITAINKDNNSYATCLVEVTAAITSLQIDKGTSYTTSVATPFVFMEAVYQPTNATSTEMEWSSSNTTVATVDATGMVTVKAIGTTTITVKPTYNPNGVFAQCVLTVKDDPITNIRTDVTSLSMIRGQTYEVKVTLTPTNPTDSTLKWTSSKPSVATVNNGYINAVGVGTATIMVQGGNANPVMIEVTVREKIDSMAFEESAVNITVKETKELKVVFTPATVTSQTLTFYSSDTSVVTVDANGKITGIKEGQAMITCVAADLGNAKPITCMVTVGKEIIPATDFDIDPKEQEIAVGQTFEITPKFTPENTSDQSVTYEVLDNSVATVDENGVVTGVKAGQTVIQCTATASKLTALCTVKVINAISFKLSPSSREIAIGKSFQITKVTKPSNADQKATWESGDSAIASVSSSGKVTGKRLGSTTITCTLTKYNQSATCRVKVAKLRSTIKLNKSSIRMNVGSTFRLKKTVWSNNTTNPSVKFTSKNSRIAKVGSSSGKITAKRVGSTIITAKTMDAVHATAKCRVIVIRRVTSISLNKTYGVCYIGRTLKLKATVKPKNASIKRVKWASSAKTVASVTGSGKVTGYSEGETYISATTTDGSNKKARCLVKVIETVPTSSVLISQTDLTMKKGDTAKLTYTILPENHSDTIKMASDNKRVATVTNSGKIKAVGTGTATITITATSGVTATATVHVVALNKSSLRMRQYDTETLTVYGTTDTISWYSANNRVATVTNGKVVGRGIGSTYIYAYVNGCKMGCRVDIVSVNAKR